MDFVTWLHGQALGDRRREMPYAEVYDIGPLVEATLINGEFDMDRLVAAVRGMFPDPLDQMTYCEAIAAAEAVWRIDALDYEIPADMEAKLGKASYLCGFRSLDGKRCTHKAIAGAARCAGHGGAITDPEVRRSLLLTSYARIIEGSDVAVSALLDVAVHSRNDLARVTAAKELLDRAGLVQDQHVHLHVQEAVERGADPLDEVRARLDGVRERLLAIPSTVTPAGDSDDPDIVDAEIVEDEPEPAHVVNP